MTEKSRGRTLHVIPRKVAKRACAVPFPTNLSALTNRSATPCVVGEIHLRRSSSLKTNARPTWGPAGPSFPRRRSRWIRNIGSVAHDAPRLFLALYTLILFHSFCITACHLSMNYCFKLEITLKKTSFNISARMRQVTFKLLTHYNMLM